MSIKSPPICIVYVTAHDVGKQNRTGEQSRLLRRLSSAIALLTRETLI